MSSQPTLRQVAAGNLRAEMARHRRTSADLAHVLDCSQSSASRRMTGETGMDLDEIAIVAAWLGIAPESLIAPPAATEKVPA